MLRGPKLWVNSILNVIGVRLRFIGTHFDHNRYIIRIFIFFFFFFFFFGFSIGSHGVMQKFRTQNFVFINYYSNLLLVTQSMF